jgi:hypothetical protein
VDDPIGTFSYFAEDLIFLCEEFSVLEGGFECGVFAFHAETVAGGF